MADQQLGDFGDFLLSGDAAVIKSGGDMREAVSKRSHFWKRLYSGKDPEKTLSGGERLRSFIMLTKAGSAFFHTIGKKTQPTQPQTITQTESPWRFARVPIVYDDQTVLLNTAEKTFDAQVAVYFNLKQTYEQAAVLSKVDLMEEGLASTPSSTHDSFTSGNAPQPIFGTLISDFANTLPTGLTTVQGISPSTNTNWQNQREGFDASGGVVANGPALKALSRLARRVKFTGLPTKPEYGDRKTMPAVFACSIKALTFLEDTMRATQDVFVYIGRQDPTYPHPTVYGVPVEEVDFLTNATIYDDGAGGFATEEAATLEGPRYFACNLEDVTAYFHNRRFWYKYAPINDIEDPSRWVIWCDTYYQIHMHQRRTQGVVYPSTTWAGYSAY